MYLHYCIILWKSRHEWQEKEVRLYVLVSVAEPLEMVVMCLFWRQTTFQCTAAVGTAALWQCPPVRACCCVAVPRLAQAAGCAGWLVGASRCVNAALCSPVLKPAWGTGIGRQLLGHALAITTLKTEEEGLLQLLCLRKRVVLWAVEFNGAVILQICLLRLTPALATHFSNPLCLFSFGLLYQLKKLWGTRAAYHPAAGKQNTKLLSSASLYFSADSYSRFSLTPSWHSANI